MDRNQWISAKIKKLENEDKGRSHAQNVAIAFSMYENMKQNGGNFSNNMNKISNTNISNLNNLLNKPQNNSKFASNLASISNENIQFFDNKIQDSNKEEIIPFINYLQQVGSTYGSIEEQLKNQIYNNYEDGGKHLPEYQNGNVFTDWLGSFGNQTWNENTGQPQQQYAQPSPGGIIPQQFNMPGALPNTPPLWQQPIVTTPQTNVQNTVQQINPNQPTVTTQQPSTTQRSQISPVSSIEPTGLTYGTPEQQLTDSVKDLNIPTNFTESTNTQSDSYLQPNQKIQFFNPYGGFDIPTAASTLGSSIENKDTLGIVGSGLKLATGLARNFFGGMGLQNRNNQVMKEYYERQRNDLNRAEVLQDGGNFSDLFPGNMYDEGVSNPNMFPQFTEGSVPANGEITPFTYTEQSSYQSPEQPLQNQHYSIFQDGGVQEQQQMQEIQQQIVQALQQGIDPQEIIDNLVQQGIPEQQVIQMVQAIIQQTQSQNAPQQEQQFMQNGGKMSLAKGLTGEYITGMDKDNPIQKPNAEIENGEYVQHPTGELQKAVGDTHENGGIDVKLEDNTRILSDHLKPKIDFIRKIKKDYDIDIKSSDTYSKILDKFSKKIGLTKIVEDQEKLIKKMEKVVTTNKDEESLGLNTQYLSGELKKLEDEKKPLETERKSLFNKLFEEQEDSKPKEESSKSYQNGGNHINDAILQLAQKYNIPENEITNFFQRGGTSGRNQNRFDDRYNELVSQGYTGSKNIGEMQAWMNANYPGEVVKYFTENNQPMTAKHVDIVKDKFRDAFAKAGIPANKDSAQYTAEEKEKLKTALGANATDDFWLEGFNDNKQDWRFPILSGVPSLPAKEAIQQQITAPGIPNMYQAPNDGIIDSPIVNETEEERARRNMNLLLLPNQDPMLPGSLQPHLKITRRFDRVNPALVSPEQALQELNRQTVATKERLNIGAGAERVAGELGLSANTQDNINKIVTDTEKINSQIISNTDARNATIQATEENARAQDALSYEQRQLTAKAKTDFDINNYYNTLRENNVRNYNKVNDLNLLNQLYNDFQFNGSTVEKTSPNIQFSTNNPIYKADTTPTKKKKKQDGGRFKK